MYSRGATARKGRPIWRERIRALHAWALRVSFRGPAPRDWRPPDIRPYFFATFTLLKRPIFGSSPTIGAA